MTIEIFDINGQLIRTGKIDSENYKINLADLKTGVYYYRLTKEKSLLKTDKLIINVHQFF